VSADSVVDAVVNWFSPPAVIGLNKVYDCAPWFQDGSDWDLAGQLGWGATGFVHLAHEAETREAMGGTVGGLKKVVYDVGLVLLFQYLIPAGVDVNASGTGYRRPLNQLLEGVKTRLREDRTLGAASGVSGLGGVEIAPGGSILAAGEGDGSSGADIVIDRDIPRKDLGKVWSWQLVEFKVIEIVAA
jgi:hypothetical protein